MGQTILDELKALVGFTADDARRLQELGPPNSEVIHHLGDRFYDRLQAHEGTRQVLQRSGASTQELRETLAGWIEELFSGRYDEDYFARRCQIGQAHVRVGMPHYYMVTAMHLVREGLIAWLQGLARSDLTACEAAVNRILDIDLAIMLETYRAQSIEQVRRSERKTLEKQLSESEHWAMIGQLAATLAHEIKNPLAGISGAIQVIDKALPENDPTHLIVGEILKQIDRMDATVKDLLVYARPMDPERRWQPIGGVLEGTLSLLREVLETKGLTIQFEGAECDVQARVDAAQIHQVITNLLLNAADACRNGGRVVLSLATRDSQVFIEVSDTGVGMSPQAVQRAFEPFYTTKAQGSGLGLAICKRIIEAHGGRIELHSQEGAGTQISITLPNDS